MALRPKQMRWFEVYVPRHETVRALGNLFIVAVEGLMVFVQTTRLILFEFFSRFLRAEGRIFKPLRRPISA